MGAKFSNLKLSNLKVCHGHGSDKSRVITFHSKDQWDKHLEASKGTNKLLVIDFIAKWCAPCRRMEPVIKEFSATYTDVDFIKIDVDELATVARGFGVEAMPTFILIKKGSKVDTIKGAMKDELQTKIEKHRT